MRNLLIASAALGLIATSAIAKNGGRPLTATLTGEAEVPGPGDPDGTGSARVTVNPGTGQLCYTITVRNIEPARAAHIHEGSEDEAGPVKVNLMAPTSGCTTISRELALEILRDPADYYVNVHNAPFPGGAVRGQLGK
jgi:hypothetical protein